MCSDATTTISVLKEAIADFVRERKWEKYHNPKDLALSIGVEAGELMEVFQWLSSADSCDIDLESDRGIRLQEELADVLTYCILLADTMGIDIASLVLAKVEKNAKKYPVEKFDGVYYKPKE